MGKVYFVSGIDTDCGKSYATGFVARLWNNQGIRTITQKLIQTGNESVSEDINIHRQIMSIPFTEEDLMKWTMPEIYTYPCSPHLAAEIDARPIDFEKLLHCTQLLSERYDVVLIEGAGGLMVPLTRHYLTIDYIAENQYPILLVSSGKLGSLNHTLLSLDAIKQRGLQIPFLLYNSVPEGDVTIQCDTRLFIETYLKNHFPKSVIIDIPRIHL